MAQHATYDPGRVVLSFKGRNIVGFMDGTFVSAEREEDSWTKYVGSTGDTTRVRNRNMSGMVTITLHQSSPSNDDLYTFLAADERDGSGSGPLLVKDLGGRTIVQAEIAWIRKPPSVDFGDEVTGREWVFDCSEIDLQVRGA
jgi:hypothetical protein